MFSSNDKQKIIRELRTSLDRLPVRLGRASCIRYWIRGDESKEQAQLQLVEQFATLAKHSNQTRISRHRLWLGGQQSLPRQKDSMPCSPAFTISPVQIEMANRPRRKKTTSIAVSTSFDGTAEGMDFQPTIRFLCGLPVESISHYQGPAPNSFADLPEQILKGRNGLCHHRTGFKKAISLPPQDPRILAPMGGGERYVRGELQTMDDYQQYSRENGLPHSRLAKFSNKNCAKRRGSHPGIIKDQKKLWIFAAKIGL